MADKSKIEWTDATWQIITGCTLVDEGCRHCYAAHLIANWPALGNHPSRKGLARNNAAGEAKFTGEVRFNEAWLDQPLRWKKPRKIFVCAHGDLFHENVPDDWIDRVFAVMALCPQHTFQVLTKRPDRAREYMSDKFSDLADRIANKAVWLRLWDDPDGVHEDVWDTIMAAPLPNVWLGTSISDQASADLRIPDLLACPAAVRFVSAEPLLGPVDLTSWIGTQPWLPGASTYVGQDGLERQDIGGQVIEGIDWVIVGGESGPNARAMHPDFAKSLRDQCVAAGTDFFFKQWGEWAYLSQKAIEMALPRDLADEFLKSYPHKGDPSGEDVLYRVGKARAGRLLDGVTWDQMPGVAA